MKRAISQPLYGLFTLNLLLRCIKDWVQLRFSDFLQAYISVIKYTIKLQ